MKQLLALQKQGMLTSLDVSFAQLMCRLSANESNELALAAALASHATANGHVCLDLNFETGKKIYRHEDPLSIQLPSYEEWVMALRGLPVIGNPGDYRPLILDEAGRLYLYRYWKYEQDLAQALHKRAGVVNQLVDEARLRDGLYQLFPASLAKPNWQKVAAAAAVLNQFSVISGGPGTGKTSTVIRILALLRQQPNGLNLKIALAAPTGKAAARMQEAIYQAKQQLPVDESIRDAIPEQATTLHRLLGASMDSIYFRHNKENPLPVDVLILDEASMVDVALMAKLMWALPDKARLIMLGDKDQLSSVEAGAVLADICGTQPQFSDGFRTRLVSLVGDELPPQKEVALPMADSILLLHQSYRFTDKSGIGQLAKSVNQGDGKRALTLLNDKALPDIGLNGGHDGIAEQAADNYQNYLECLKREGSVDDVFAAFNSFRALCAVRGGPYGVVTLNQKIEAVLAARNLINIRHDYYAGRPIMVTHNDNGLRLYNGDVGLLLPDSENGGLLRACFQSSDGVIRKIAPAMLPEHETVYAMTVHKSQGSEFDKVLLVLPKEDNLLLSRELVYTGITRARSGFELYAGNEILLAAVQRKLSRTTGLQDLLWRNKPAVRANQLNTGG